MLNLKPHSYMRNRRTLTNSRNRNFFKVTAGAMLIGCVSTSALAVDEKSIEEIAVIATRLAQPVSDLSSNVSVLGESALSKLAPVHIQQALSQVPGVSLQRGNGQESLPAIRSAVQTGAGACGSVLVLEEGIPVRGAGSCNVNELFDTHFEQASRIEVVRGANSSFYGSNALNGSVNIVLPASGTNRLAIEAGPNQYWRAKAAVSYKLGDSGVMSTLERNAGRFYVTLADDGGYRENAGYQQEKFSWRHQLDFSRWEWELGATITQLDQQTAGFIVGLDSYRDPVLAKQNLDPEAFRRSDSARLWVSATRHSDRGNKLRSTVYARDTEMQFLQHFLPGDPLEQNAQRGIGWQSVYYVEASTALNWALGVDGELNDSSLRQSQAQPTLGSAFLQATIPVGTHYDYQVDSEQLAIFTHLDWQWAERWRLLTGARLETMRYDYDNLTLTGRTRDDGTACGFGGCRYSRPADRNDRFTNLSPRMEMRFQANQQWRWSLTLSDSFRSPQATELYRLQRDQVVADLDVVNARTIEVSTRYESANTQFELSLFDIDTQNVIVRDGDFFNVDGQRTQSRGVEFALQHQFNAQWQARLIGSLAEHTYASDQRVGDVNLNGNQVDTAPNAFGSAFLGWLVSDKLSLESELQTMGDYYTDPENNSRYPGHTLLHLRGSYQLSDRWRVSLRALNLTDRRYAERADFTSFTNERYFPGMPRSLYAELAMEF
ncbi:TonB-dependent receptor [Arenicella xantha]|uniref:Outer membrane receptor protein involved in Fe transport n=1 Tax=Arenicella xantha TaxID=644221 RepID=A0A395JQW6_9GAMM|nr:TonB-dependent receptor [Arenicella xantha]RBP52722.1 outer membrane receptor protein involved in Fe transport [Arenicella xantha]